MVVNMGRGMNKQNKLTLWLLAIALVTTLIMFAFAFYETRHLDHLKTQYVEDTRGISTETILLSQLSRENGYGGFIHNFKNFVLRHDIRYLNAARSNMTEIKNIKLEIRTNLSPKHIPSKIFEVSDIPKTKSGKIVELSIKNIINGLDIQNKNSLANPDCLKEYEYIYQDLKKK